MTLGDNEGRIQGVIQIFTYALLSQERIKLHTSTLARIFIESMRTKGHYKFVAEGSVGVSRGYGKFLCTLYYLSKG